MQKINKNDICEINFDGIKYLLPNPNPNPNPNQLINY